MWLLMALFLFDRESLAPSSFFLDYFFNFCLTKLGEKFATQNTVSQPFGVARAFADAALGHRTGESKVADFYVTVLVYQDIGCFDIPVHDVSRMENF